MIEARDVGATPFRKPERTEAGNNDLSSVSVSTEHKIDPAPFRYEIAGSRLMTYKDVHVIVNSVLECPRDVMLPDKEVVKTENPNEPTAVIKRNRAPFMARIVARSIPLRQPSERPARELRRFVAA